MSYDLFGTTLDDLEHASLILLDRVIETYKPAKVWALFSGGCDSVASSLLASKHPAFSGVLHLDTETGVPETRQYVERVSNERGWSLVIEPPRTASYDALIEHFGFPGRGKHGAAYAHLKDRALSRMTARKRAGKGVLLVAGARTGESDRRMSNSKFFTEQLEKNRIWLNPILHWTKDACKDYAARYGVEPSIVSKKLGMSGECLCGCFARPGEVHLLDAHFPHVSEQIRWRERKAEVLGVWPHWGIQPPKSLDKWPNSPEIDQFMCTDCLAKRVA